MDGQKQTTLADVALQIVTLSAREYLSQHNLVASKEALTACVVSWTKIKLPEALRDAKEALASPLTERYAEATFKASMVLAGIEAAKEAGFPKELEPTS